MGKAPRWLRGLLGKKKDKDCGSSNWDSGDRKAKKRWSFLRSENKIPASAPDVPSAWLKSFFADSDEKSKHAMAVAAATAAADAAVVAAQAAVAVVRLTSHGRGALFSGASERWAAISIQSVFRGYLARKALRALKGLVKLQALVRGYLVRKRAAQTLRSMEAMIRAQAAVQADRACRSMDRRFGSGAKPMDEFHGQRLSSSNGSPLPSFRCDSPKVVEVDVCRPEPRSRRIMSPCYMPEYGYDAHYSYLKPSSFSCRIPTHSDSRHFHNLNWGFVEEDYKFPTAQSTPRFASTGWTSGAQATPARRRECGDRYLGGYPNYPSYMAETQSFRAKSRSQSAPKHRPETGPKRRLSLNEMMGARISFAGARFRRVSCPEVAEEVELLF